MLSSVSPPRRVAAGAALFINLIALAAAAKAVLYDTIDPDCFLHLLAADQLLRDGIGPIVDHQSFASVPKPWTPYSWLAELGMKWVWDAGGFRAAVVTHAAMSGAIVALAAGACLIRARVDEDEDTADESAPRVMFTPPVVSRFSAIVATCLTAFLSLPYLSFRPVTAAVLMLAGITLLIVRDRRMNERSKAVWLVIPLTALTVNLHLFAAAVPLYLGAMLLGALWERRNAFEAPDWPEGDRRAWRCGLLLAGTCLACLATPMIAGFPAALLHLQFDPIVTGPVIAEYQPFYRGGLGVAAAVCVGALVLSAYLHRRKLRAGEIIWLLLAFAMLLRMGRFAPIFAVGAAPIFAVTLPRLSERLLGRLFVRVAIIVVLAIGVWRVGLSVPTPDTNFDRWVNRHGPDTPGYPTDAAAFVEANVRPTTGRLINEYTWGGYLGWRFKDQFQVLLDGRTQCYSNEFWRVTYLAGEDARRDFFSRIRADAAVLPVRRSTFRDALVDLGWTSVYTDDRSEVLLPPPTRVETETDWAWTAAFFGGED